MTRSSKGTRAVPACCTMLSRHRVVYASPPYTGTMIVTTSLIASAIRGSCGHQVEPLGGVGRPTQESIDDGARGRRAIEGVGASEGLTRAPAPARRLVEHVME